jgi:prepilin-type N-terminal cleavage/methylation domain-containing protein
MMKNAGFSLPEIMVALGLLGGVSLVTMRMMDNHTKGQATLKHRAEIQKASAIVENVLKDKDNCRLMLRGNTVTSTPTTIIPHPDITPGNIASKIPNHTALNAAATDRTLYLPYKSGNVVYYKPLLRVGQVYPGFEMTDIQISHAMKFSGITTGVNDVAQLSLTFESPPKSRRYIKKDITFLYKHQSNVLTDCGPVLSDATDEAKRKLCLSMGPMVQWEDGKCEFVTKKCAWNEVPVEFGSDGAKNCVPANTRLKGEDLFDTNTSCTLNPGGSVWLESVSGKLRVRCN